MLDIACYEISVLLGECHFVENSIIRVWERLATWNPFSRYTFVLNSIDIMVNNFGCKTKLCSS